MKRFVFTLLVIMLVSGSIFAACAAPAPTPTPVPTPTPPPVQKLAPTAEKPLELKFSYHSPPQSGLAQKMLKGWSSAIESDAKGRIKITHYGGESLVKLNDQYDALISGLSDIGQVATDATPGRFVLSGINQLPYLFPTARLGGRVYNELLLKYAADTEWKEAKILWCPALSPHQLFSNKQVQKLEDFKGMKIRIEGRVEGWTAEALGAAGAELSTPDLQQALERGTVDGCFLQWAGALTFGIQQVTKHRTELNIFSRSFVVAMSRKLWDQLPTDIQLILDQYSSPTRSEFYSAQYEVDVVGARGAIAGFDTKAGNPGIVVPSAEEAARIRNAAMPVREKWVAEAEAKKLPARAMLNDAVALVAKYAPMQIPLPAPPPPAAK